MTRARGKFTAKSNNAKIQKSVNIYQSYERILSGTFLWPTVYIDNTVAQRQTSLLLPPFMIFTFSLALKMCFLQLVIQFYIFHHFMRLYTWLVCCYRSGLCIACTMLCKMSVRLSVCPAAQIQFFSDVVRLINCYIIIIIIIIIGIYTRPTKGVTLNDLGWLEWLSEIFNDTMHVRSLCDSSAFCSFYLQILYPI